MSCLSSDSNSNIVSDLSFGEPSSPPSSSSGSDTVGVKTSDTVSATPISSTGPDENESPKVLRRPKHSLDAKRLMRKQRKKRKRFQKKTSKAELQQELRKVKEVHKSSEIEVLRYKSMARSYWQWERKEVMRTRRHQRSESQSLIPVLHEINPDYLTDPVVDGKPNARYIGRGSFSVVRLQVYRDVTVAVKEFLPHSIRSDVVHEASIIAILICRTYLEYVKIVTQFHSVNSTLRQEMQSLSQSVGNHMHSHHRSTVLSTLRSKHHSQ